MASECGEASVPVLTMSKGIAATSPREGSRGSRHESVVVVSGPNLNA